MGIEERNWEWYYQAALFECEEHGKFHINANSAQVISALTDEAVKRHGESDFLTTSSLTRPCCDKLRVLSIVDTQVDFAENLQTVRPSEEPPPGWFSKPIRRSDLNKQKEA